MPYSCLIVEDEPLARSLMEEYVKKIPELQLVKTCSNALDALHILRTEAIDVLFSDIQMPELTGISLLKILNKKPLVVLTTAYSEYAIEGYELDVLDYLLKPITFDRFLKATEKILHRLSTTAHATDHALAEKQSDFIFVKDGTKLVRIKVSDILYFEGLKDYVCVHTIHQKVVTLQTMKHLEEQLPKNLFIRIHNSYIVAIAAIEVVERERVQIGKHHLPISDSYRKPFKEALGVL